MKILIPFGKLTPLFPDCFRWIKNGQYEQYLELPSVKKTATFKKPKNTPF